MTKRKRKKLKKKQELFALNFASSYREVRQIDRSYHEFIVDMLRAKSPNNIYDLLFGEGYVNWRKK